MSQSNPYVDGPKLFKSICRKFKIDPQDATDITMPECWEVTERAWYDIRTPIIAKGYSDTQIANWDHVEMFVKDQCIFRAFVAFAGLGGWDDKDYKLFDRRKEIEADGFVILTNGQPVQPAVTISGGEITSGTVGRGHLGRSPGVPRDSFGRRGRWCNPIYHVNWQDGDVCRDTDYGNPSNTSP
jgi:hypothetical protein